jgi:hypothetical protein
LVRIFIIYALNGMKEVERRYSIGFGFIDRL